jgi:uncharacterized RDD family membrane protein YckC
MYDDKQKRDDALVYDLADVGSRFIALVIDNIIIAVIGGVLGAVFSSNALVGIVGFLIGLGYNWYFWTTQDGQTLGKRILGLRVVKADGTPITTTDAFVRYFGYYINSFVFALGWIWALFDSNRQGWHDKLAKTYVVKA